MGRVDLQIDGERVTLDLSRLGLEHLRLSGPVRALRWFKGQKHFPGWYWSTTEDDLVMYESRLELARLRIADFDPDVVMIRPQPFEMWFPDVDGKARRHVPDYALVDAAGLVTIVNVKPLERLLVDEIREALEGAHRELEREGFPTQIWSGDTPVRTANLRFVAGFRNPQLFDPKELKRMRGAIPEPATIAAAAEVGRTLGVEQPQNVLMHLVWTHHLRVDWNETLQPTSVLEPV